MLNRQQSELELHPYSMSYYIDKISIILDLDSRLKVIFKQSSRVVLIERTFT